MPELKLNTTNIAFIGYGEAGAVFSQGILAGNPDRRVAAFDIKTTQAETRAAKLKAFEQHGVVGCEDTGEAIAQAGIIFSTVTADRAYEAAEQAARHPLKGAIFADCNSCAPDTKRASARIIEAAGGRYVDAAVMAPVGLPLTKTPFLLSGPHAPEALAALIALGFTAREKVGDVGLASSIKMTRSIMIKGMEALVMECVLAGRKAGIDDEVLASLDKSFPGFDWKNRTAYMFERMMTHGIRRAAEMREVVKTVDDLGLPNPMSAAIVEWQQLIGAQEIDAAALPADDYATYADHILDKISPMGEGEAT